MKSMYSEINVEKYNQPKIATWSLKLTTFSIYLFVAEVILGQSGRALEIGPISFRIALAFWIILVSLPIVYSNFKKIIKFKFIQAFIVFVLILCVWTVIGYSNGNSLGRIFGDWTSFYVLFMGPAFVAVILESDHKRVYLNILNIIVVCATILSLVTIVYHFIYPALSFDTRTLIENFVTETQFGGVAVLGRQITRIYLRSQVFIPVAIGIVFWDLTHGDNMSWKKVLILGVLYFGLLLSFTRSYWLATFVAFLLLILLNTGRLKRIFIILLISLIPFIILQTASQIVYKENATVIGVKRVILSYGPESSDTSSVPIPNSNGDNNPKDQDESDKLRSSLTRVLVTSIKQSPIVGHGMGYVASEIRPGGWTEYFYLDMVTKFGVVGFAAFLALLCAPLYYVLKFKNDTVTTPSVLTLSVIAVVSIFNPYLNNAIGLTAFLVVFMGATVCYMNRNDDLIQMNFKMMEGENE